MAPSSATAGPFTAAEIAERLGGTLEGDGSVELVDVRGLAEASGEHLSFLANAKYAPQLRSTGAGAVLVDPQADAHGKTVIRLADPYAGFARALALFHPVGWPEPGIDPRAYVDPGAQVDPTATVEAFAWIGNGAEVGAGTWVEAGAYVGRGAAIGARSRLMAGSVVCDGCVLGERVWLNPGAVIGGEGFGFAPSREGHVKIPQIGRAVVGDDVEIGANSCVDRGAINDTLVGRGAKLDNLVQIGHGAEAGEGALMAAYAALSGSAKTGRGVMIGGKAGLRNHVTIGDGVTLSAQCVALSDQPDGADLAGTPAIDRQLWLRAVTAFRRLPELLRQVRRLEKRVAELEAERAGGKDGSAEEEASHVDP